MSLPTRSVWILAAITISLQSSQAAAQQIGQILTKKAQYGASANWDGSDSSEAVIQIPAGCIVVDTKDERRSKYGRTSMNVSHIEARGHFASAQDVQSSFKSLEDAMVNAGKYGAYQAKINQEKQQWLSTRNQISSSHSAIVVRVKATGSHNFFDRKGASIQGTYVATLRYVGTKADLQNAVMGLLKEAGNDKGYTVQVRNPDFKNVTFKFRFNDGKFEPFSLAKGSSRSFFTKALTPRFTVVYDADLSPGEQARTVQLNPGLKYKFQRQGSAVRLVKD